MEIQPGVKTQHHFRYLPLLLVLWTPRPTFLSLLASKRTPPDHEVGRPRFLPGFVDERYLTVKLILLRR